MVLPLTDNPNKYQPNPVDDRALGEHERAAYLNLATAIEAIEGLYDRPTEAGDEPGPLYAVLPPGSRKAIRQAENALRRAAWILVIHHRHEG